MAKRRKLSSEQFGPAIERLAEALDVEPEHFREYRLRVITDQLEEMPDLVDRLYKRLSV